MIGPRLRAARRAAGMSQEELGAAIGVSKMAVSKYESGAAVPGSARLAALAEALGVPVSWILEPTPPGAVRPLAARAHPLRGELSGRASSALIGQRPPGSSGTELRSAPPAAWCVSTLP